MFTIHIYIYILYIIYLPYSYYKNTLSLPYTYPTLYLPYTYPITEPKNTRGHARGKGAGPGSKAKDWRGGKEFNEGKVRGGKKVKIKTAATLDLP